MEQDAINDAKNGSIPSDPQCKSNQNGQRESGALAKGSQSELNILDHAHRQRISNPGSFMAFSVPEEARCKHNSLKTTRVGPVFDNGTLHVENERFERAAARDEEIPSLLVAKRLPT